MNNDLDLIRKTFIICVFYLFMMCLTSRAYDSQTLYPTALSVPGETQNLSVFVNITANDTLINNQIPLGADTFISLFSAVQRTETYIWTVSDDNDTANMKVLVTIASAPTLALTSDTEDTISFFDYYLLEFESLSLVDYTLRVMVGNSRVYEDSVAGKSDSQNLSLIIPGSYIVGDSSVFTISALSSIGLGSSINFTLNKISPTILNNILADTIISIDSAVTVEGTTSFGTINIASISDSSVPVLLSLTDDEGETNVITLALDITQVIPAVQILQQRDIFLFISQPSGYRALNRGRGR